MRETTDAFMDGGGLGRTGACPARDRAGTEAETAKVRLAVGGKSSLYYLPLTITERLGYFKEAGLDVEISDFAGGAKSLQALIGGSADVVTGSFDHTIQMQAKNQAIVAVVQLGRFPASRSRCARRRPRTTRPEGSEGHEDRRDRAGLEHAFHGALHDGAGRAEAGRRGVHRHRLGRNGGRGGAARRSRRHFNADPMITKLDRDGAIKVVADTRTLEGTTKVYGGPYPAAVLYTPPRSSRRIRTPSRRW
jgi:NitT/TauT family transport system substrate-binding protein